MAQRPYLSLSSKLLPLAAVCSLAVAAPALAQAPPPGSPPPGAYPCGPPPPPQPYGAPAGSAPVAQQADYSGGEYPPPPPPEGSYPPPPTGTYAPPPAGYPAPSPYPCRPPQDQRGGPGHCGPGGGPGGPPKPNGTDVGERDVSAERASAEGPEHRAPQGRPECAPDFKRGFLNRVWKFVGEADGFDDGVLSMTVDKILNLPKRFRDQDDEIVDEDARVLVGKRVRVYRDRKRVASDELADAESVRVHGKMLRPDKWMEDEDENPVPTIRAKKVYILG